MRFENAGCKWRARQDLDGRKRDPQSIALTYDYEGIPQAALLYSVSSRIILMAETPGISAPLLYGLTASMSFGTRILLPLW